MTDKNISPQNIFIPGPVGKIEAIVAPSADTTNTIGIICHPHPLYGGTMHNKVVTTLARTFNELDMASIRFNFRGIGKSAGSYGHGEGETDDLLAVIAWVRQHFPECQLWLAGFSFGAYVAMQGAIRTSNIQQLITIAPAVNHFSFSDAANIRCPWLLVMGEADEIVPIDAVKNWVKQQPVPIKTIYFPGVSHFFHGHLTELREHIKLAVQNS